MYVYVGNMLKIEWTEKNELKFSKIIVDLEERYDIQFKKFVSYIRFIYIRVKIVLIFTYFSL